MSSIGNSRRRLSRGLSLLEITIGIIVFASALLPVLMLTTTSMKQTATLEDHLLAAEFAANVLDRFLSLPFRECRDAVKRETAQRSVLAELGTGGSPAGALPAGFKETLAKSFRDFTWQVKLTPATDKDEIDQMFTLEVKVQWPAGSKGTRQFSLSAMKFNEDP